MHNTYPNPNPNRTPREAQIDTLDQLQTEQNEWLWRVGTVRQATTYLHNRHAQGLAAEDTVPDIDDPQLKAEIGVDDKAILAADGAIIKCREFVVNLSTDKEHVNDEPVVFNYPPVVLGRIWQDGTSDFQLEVGAGQRPDDFALAYQLVNFIELEELAGALPDISADKRRIVPQPVEQAG
jgi:hypothetical protein